MFFFPSKLVLEIGYKPALCSFRFIWGFFSHAFYFPSLQLTSDLWGFFGFLPNKKIEKNKGETGKEQGGKILLQRCISISVEIRVTEIGMNFHVPQLVSKAAENGKTLRSSPVVTQGPSLASIC